MEETDTRSFSEDADLQREVRIHSRRKAEMGGDLPQREKKTGCWGAELPTLGSHEIPRILTRKLLFFKHLISFQQVLSI